MGSPEIVCTRSKCGISLRNWKPDIPKCVPKEQPASTTQTNPTTNF